MFAQRVAGNPQALENLRAATAGARGSMDKLENLLPVLRATGMRPRAGSQTQPRQQIQEMLGEGAAGIPGWMAAPMSTTRRAIAERAKEQTLEELGRLFTSPGGIKKIQQLAGRADELGSIARGFLSAQRAATGLSLGLLGQ